MQTPQILTANQSCVIQQKSLQFQHHTQTQQLTIQNAPNQNISILNDQQMLSAILTSKQQKKQQNLINNKRQNNRLSPKKKLESDLQKYFNTYDMLKKKNQKQINTKKEQNLLASTPIKDIKNTQKLKQETKGRTEVDENSYEEQEQQELMRYTQLTGKLKHALNSIQTTKYSTQKVTLNQDNINQMNKRFQIYQKKRKQQIQKRAQQLQHQELRQLKSKPTINKTLSTSMKIDPIYERYSKLIEAKNKKLQEERKKKQKQKQEQFLQYQRIFNQKNKKPQKIRTQQQFYEELVRWKNKKQQKVKEKLELEKTKAVEGVTFKPIINEKSKKLLMKSNRQPIYQREPKPPKIIQQEFTFKPQLNKKIHKKQ